MKAKHKTFSLYEDQQLVIEKEFKDYGSLSDFIRYCINDKEKIESFIKPSKAMKMQMVSLYQKDLELIEQQIGTGKFSSYIRHCISDPNQISKFKTTLKDE